MKPGEQRQQYERVKERRKEKRVRLSGKLLVRAFSPYVTKQAEWASASISDVSALGFAIVVKLAPQLGDHLQVSLRAGMRIDDLVEVRSLSKIQNGYRLGCTPCEHFGRGSKQTKATLTLWGAAALNEEHQEFAADETPFADDVTLPDAKPPTHRRK